METTRTRGTWSLPRPRTLLVAVVVAALAAFGLYAAVTGNSGAASDEPYSPFELGPATPAGVTPVTLDTRAAGRIGLVTAPVRAAEGRRTVIPYSAVVYDPEGVAWTYVATGPLSFVRRKLGVARIDGVVAVLTSGPPVGTKVVSVGGAELFGAEIDFGDG
jgi:hypothetical protein